MRVNHSNLVFEYISQREGEHLSNAVIAEDLNISKAVVSRVMYYGIKTVSYTHLRAHET